MPDSSTLKAVASWNSLYGERRHLYRIINHTGSGTSINVFLYCTSIARLEGNFGWLSICAYKILSFGILAQN